MIEVSEGWTADPHGPTRELHLTRELIRHYRAVRAARNLYAAVQALGDSNAGPILPVLVAAEQVGNALAAIDKEGER